MIKLRECSKLFGNSLALNKVSLDISAPGLILLLGGNGAGKSTLLRICAGLVAPSSGSVQIDQKISYLGHGAMLYPQLTVRENLGFFRSLQSSGRQNDIPEWLELDDLQDKIVSELSQGQKARAGLARVLMGSEDRALLLDEPASAFDRRWQQLFISRIRELCTSHLVMIVTHDPEHFIDFTERVLIISQASLLHDFNMKAVPDRTRVIDAFHEVLR